MIAMREAHARIKINLKLNKVMSKLPAGIRKLLAGVSNEVLHYVELILDSVLDKAP